MTPDPNADVTPDPDDDNTPPAQQTSAQQPILSHEQKQVLAAGVASGWLGLTWWIPLALGLFILIMVIGLFSMLGKFWWVLLAGFGLYWLYKRQEI